MTIPGVVHKYVDRPDSRLDFGDDTVDRFKVGYIEHLAHRLTWSQCFERVPCLFASDSTDHAVTCGKRFFGQRASEAAADTGNEKGFDG
ncbi:hypothetical protein PPGU19_076830 (plasmid) [Paraburkholderia sp. PGU19]|nr:hypothetical protein PPGU19_076830 [Paraburkholderia sp. PGU19]